MTAGTDKAASERKELSIFRDTPHSIKTLRQFYKKNPNVPTLNELKEESDRAAVIVMATLLDDGLALRIADCLHFKPTDEERDHIFRFEGPLGTFSARIEIALYFNCIDDITYQQLDIVRELRNVCAHSSHPMVFSESAFANVAKRMFFPLGIVGVENDKPQLLRAAFHYETAAIYATMYLGSRKEAVKRITVNMKDVPEGFVWPPQPRDKSPGR